MNIDTNPEMTDLQEETNNKPTLEDMFLQMDDLIHQLENPNTSLNDAFLAYKKGMDLVKDCNESIDRVEKEVKILAGNEEEDEQF